MNFQEFHSKVDYVDASVRCIERVCNSQDVVHIALSGGSTPKPVYEALSKNQNIDFSKVEFWMVDERYVPSDSEFSNQRVIRETLIDRLGQRLRAFHSFDTSLSVDNTVKQYQNEFDHIEQLDLCILGIGTDGHTASLMVGEPSVHNEMDLVLVANNPFHPNPPVQKRMTLGWKAIMGSQEILLLASGKKKAQAMDDLFKENVDIEHFPSKKLLEHSHFSVHYLNV